MCGIAGIWDWSERQMAKSKIKIMTDEISHRGPDGEGAWFSEDGSIALGHRRLSIIDLSEKGKQPMIYAERYVITFNGEIYNYLEIKNQLTQKGFVFNTATDTEVIIAAYSFWGAKCLEQFDGMFAFAIYDKEIQELFCARDRFGEKPFYYYIDDEKLIFASEMKAIWAAGVNHSIDDYSMYLFINMGLHEDPADKTRTFFSNIKRLQAGHYMLFRKGQFIEQKKYWEINLAKKKLDISFEQACETFRELFFLSVKRRLRSDVPIGTSLSGGLDSSAVALTMYQMLSGASVQKCFSARFNDPMLDEFFFMQKVVKNKSIDHFTTYPSVDNLINEIERIVYYQEEPFLSSSIYAQWEVFKIAKENGVTVLLDGQGADEILAGYTYYFDPFFRETYRKKGLKALNQEIKSSKSNNEFSQEIVVDNMFKLRSLFPTFFIVSKNIKRHIVGAGSTAYIHKELHRAYHHKKNPFSVFQELDESLLYSTSVSGLDKLLRFADRNAMAHSIEVRLPFLFHELVEFLFSLPSDYKIHNGWTKAPIRFGLSDLLPDEVCWRKSKLGFQTPQKSWEKNASFAAIMNEYQQIAVKNKYINPKAPPCWEGFITGVFISKNQ